MKTAVCMQKALCRNGRCRFLGRLRNRSHYVIITNTISTLLQSCNRHKKSPTQLIVLGKTSCEGLYKDGLDYDQFGLIGQPPSSHHIFYRQLNSNRQIIDLKIQWICWQQQSRLKLYLLLSLGKTVAHYRSPESKKAARTALFAHHIHANCARTLFAICRISLFVGEGEGMSAFQLIL